MPLTTTEYLWIPVMISALYVAYRQLYALEQLNWRSFDSANARRMLVPVGLLALLTTVPLLLFQQDALVFLMGFAGLYFVLRIAYFAQILTNRSLERHAIDKAQLQRMYRQIVKLWLVTSAAVVVPIFGWTLLSGTNDSASMDSALACPAGLLLFALFVFGLARWGFPLGRLPYVPQAKKPGSLLLKNQRGDLVQFKIAGYQYPLLETFGYWDANWLNVELTAEHNNQRWTAVESCLLTFELEKLALWFEQVAADYAQAPCVQDFIEPGLSFSLVNAGAHPAVRVTFRFGIQPLWTPASNVKEPSAGSWLDFALEEIDLTRAAISLRNMNDLYPEIGRRYNQS